jgi:hypothetical protein
MASSVSPWTLRRLRLSRPGTDVALGVIPERLTSSTAPAVRVLPRCAAVQRRGALKEGSHRLGHYTVSGNRRLRPVTRSSLFASLLPLLREVVPQGRPRACLVGHEARQPAAL